ncbi:DUF732 domain-containing protein [Kitasatospora sp. NPDC091276]|uniref:DUF732 domain-containing protein n=1 Tax=Kitasatospora sp. NPDC091276 TaxID=3155300 RepID=UPI003444384E
MSRKKWLVIGGAVLAFGAVLSLFEDKPDKATAEAKPSASAPAPQAPAETPKQPSGAPSPDQAQTAALVASLRAVDPALVAKEDKAVSRARDTCLDLRSGKDAATVQKNAAARFTGGSVAVTDDQAAKIVDAVKGSFCG